MANKKIFTSESLATLINEIKSYVSNAVSKKANTSHTHAISDITNLQTTLDAKASSSHTHKVANISDLTATATELNYMDGVKSNVQTQLDGKAASSHTHTIANITNLQSTLDGKSSTSHTHNYAGSSSVGGAANSLGVFDTRAINDTPAEITNLIGGKGLRLDFKNVSTVGLDNGTYSAVMSISPWSDTTNWSGGKNTQLGFCDNGRIKVRKGNNGGWTDWNTIIDSETIGSQSVNYATSAGSATKATQLATARTIALGTGVTGTATSFNGTGNITIPVTDIKESYLSWGGKNLSGSVSPLSAALSTEHSANRIAYLNPNAIYVEYSNDAGSTWTDSGLANSAKINLVTTSNSVPVGSNSPVTVSHRTRITLTAQDGTNGYVYTRPRKMLINVSTPHGLNVTIEAKTGASGASWTTLGTYTLSGWSGWNDIPIGISTFGGGTNQTSNYWYMRLTFANNSVNSSYTTTKSSIIGLRLFGDTCWTRTSNMGDTGHLYSYDYSQNATFPANVTATTFIGSLSGNATTATTASKLGSSTVGGASKPIYLNAGVATACSSTVGSATKPAYMNGGIITACTYSLEKSVPSNAIFTDNNVTNTLAATTKAYITGTTSATTNTGTQVFDTGVYLDTTAGKLVATTFGGTTFTGGGVATVSEVESYLGI